MKYSDLKVGMTVKTKNDTFAIVEKDFHAYRLGILPNPNDVGQIINKQIWGCYIKEIYYTDEDGKICCDVPEIFKPHLCFNYKGAECGNIGEETNHTLCFGERLYVGDIVEIYSIKTERIIAKSIVVNDGSSQFVSGCKDVMFKNGISELADFQIRKVKSFKDLGNNERIDNIFVKLCE